MLYFYIHNKETALSTLSSQASCLMAAKLQRIVYTIPQEVSKKISQCSDDSLIDTTNKFKEKQKYLPFPSY